MSGFGLNGNGRHLFRLGFASVIKDDPNTCFKAIYPKNPNFPDKWEEMKADGFCVKGSAIKKVTNKRYVAFENQNFSM